MKVNELNFKYKDHLVIVTRDSVILDPEPDQVERVAVLIDRKDWSNFVSLVEELWEMLDACSGEGEGGEEVKGEQVRC